MAKIMRGKQSPVQPRKQSIGTTIMSDKSFTDGLKSGAGNAIASVLVTAALSAIAKAVVEGGGK